MELDLRGLLKLLSCRHESRGEGRDACCAGSGRASDRSRSSSIAREVTYPCSCAKGLHFLSCSLFQLCVFTSVAWACWLPLPVQDSDFRRVHKPEGVKSSGPRRRLAIYVSLESKISHTEWQRRGTFRHCD